MTYRTCLTSLTLSLALAACGGGGGSDADAGSSDDGDDDGGDNCDWPIDTATEAGSIELGTGTGSWQPMPEEIPFILGTQGGTYLVLHSRIKDLEPGNVENFLDPLNPMTRFSATLFDGTVVGRACPSRLGYEPAGEGYYERKQYQNLEFLPFSLGEGAFDTVVKLKVEIIDAEGRYATDEKDVLCRAPAGWEADAGPEDAGPESDAGAADAGPEVDASP